MKTIIWIILHAISEVAILIGQSVTHIVKAVNSKPGNRAVFTITLPKF